MSRIIKSIIESAWPTEEINLICCLSRDKISDVLKTDLKLFCLEQYKWDTNNKLILITPEQISHNLSLSFRACVCDTFAQYDNSLNIARQLRIPIINIIKEKEHFLKKEGIFALASEQLINDINLISSDNLANELYISNYELIKDNLQEQIIKNINDWIPD